MHAHVAEIFRMNTVPPPNAVFVRITQGKKAVGGKKNLTLTQFPITFNRADWFYFAVELLTSADDQYNIKGVMEAPEIRNVSSNILTVAL